MEHTPDRVPFTSRASWAVTIVVTDLVGRYSLLSLFVPLPYKYCDRKSISGCRQAVGKFQQAA